jgi:ABC-type maltose transport system permease subunit
MTMMALSKAKKQAMHFTTESLMKDFVHLYHLLEEYGDFIPPKFILAGLKGLDNAASGRDASDKVYSDITFDTCSFLCWIALYSNSLVAASFCCICGLLVSSMTAYLFIGSTKQKLPLMLLIHHHQLTQCKTKDAQHGNVVAMIVQ